MAGLPANCYILLYFYCFYFYFTFYFYFFLQTYSIFEQVTDSATTLTNVLLEDGSDIEDGTENRMPDIKAAWS